MLVFIDLDEAYLTALERKFVEELGEFANISIITDMCYFSEYFSIPREIDILVVNEQLYDAQLSNHSIGITYILTENPVDNAKNNNYRQIYNHLILPIPRIFFRAVLRFLLYRNFQSVYRKIRFLC